MEHKVHLPGRGTTFVREVKGPRHAPVLLLVHGWVASSEVNWFPVLEELGKRYRVIAMDLRGHGRGIRPLGGFQTTPFSLEDCADDLSALLRQYRIPKAHVVGYSMGGPVAQLLWQRHPEQVAGLVLASTAAEFSQARPLRDVVSQAARMYARMPLTRAVTKTSMKSLGFLRHVPVVNKVSDVVLHDPLALTQAADAIAHFSSKSWIPRIDVPVSVVRTTRDTLALPCDQQWLVEHIPGARDHVVTSPHGHFAFLTDPSKFWPVLVRACDSVVARAGNMLTA
ncbi:MAG: alpha/beta fold hydrolase [Candidatus Dormibacteria bacterium]